MSVLKRLWSDQSGFVMSAELVLVVTVALLAVIVGLASARDGVNSELADMADAVNELNQGYVYNHILGHSGTNHGSQYVDSPDYCEEGPDDSNPAADEQCITHQNAVFADEGTRVFPTEPE